MFKSKKHISSNTNITSAKNGAVFFQPKLAINQPNDVYEQEADAMADKVMRMSTTSERFFKPSPSFTHVIQRQDGPTETPGKLPEIPHLELSSSSLFSSSTNPDYLALRQPFFSRNIPHLWDPDTALQVWQYNFDFFRRVGLSPDLSTALTNFTAPRLIDSQLKAGNPTWWEITDRELKTTTFSGSIPVLEFTPNFSPVAPSWLKTLFGGGSSVQRKCAACEEEEKLQRKESSTENNLSSAQAESYINSLPGNGKPLTQDEKKFFEPKFGCDFSNVRVHADAKANESAKSVNALAYTHGNNIVFDSNKYQPNTEPGKRLLAHELTHVVQQKSESAFPGKFIQRYDKPASWCNAFMELVHYEDQNGKLSVLTHYHSLSNDLLIPLNYNIPSIYGDVDVDWMLRLAFIQYPFIITSIFSPSMSEGFGSLASRLGQIALKGGWNTIRAAFPEWDLEYGSIFEEGNWNSSPAIVAWIHEDKSLRDIFSPAIDLCNQPRE